MGAHAVQQSRGQHITQCSQSELKLAGTQKTKPTQKTGAVNHWLARDHAALRELCTHITSEFQVAFCSSGNACEHIPVCKAQDRLTPELQQAAPAPCLLPWAELGKWQHRGGEVKVGKERCS